MALQSQWRGRQAQLGRQERAALQPPAGTEQRQAGPAGVGAAHAGRTPGSCVEQKRELSPDLGFGSEQRTEGREGKADARPVAPMHASDATAPADVRGKPGDIELSGRMESRAAERPPAAGFPQQKPAAPTLRPRTTKLTSQTAESIPRSAAIPGRLVYGGIAAEEFVFPDAPVTAQSASEAGNAVGDGGGRNPKDQHNGAATAAAVSAVRDGRSAAGGPGVAVPGPRTSAAATAAADGKRDSAATDFAAATAASSIAWSIAEPCVVALWPALLACVALPCLLCWSVPSPSALCPPRRPLS